MTSASGERVSGSHTGHPTGSVLDRLLSRACVERLERTAAEHAASYRTADPFPHAVLDDFLPADVLRDVLASFPAPEQLDWQRFENRSEKKLAFREVAALPSPARDALYFLNSEPVLTFLEQLTGITGLIADPYYSGGGLHQILPGGHLGIHADFNSHDRLQLDRRLNLLLFLNEDWHEDYGGHLELWRADMSECARRVLPIFGRCVIFSTTDNSLHGHPDPLRCPPGRTRKSLATYYFTAGRPEAERSATHTTLFHARPGEVLAPERTTLRSSAKALAQAVTPPIVYRGLRRVLRGRRD